MGTGQKFFVHIRHCRSRFRISQSGGPSPVFDFTKFPEKLREKEKHLKQMGLGGGVHPGPLNPPVQSTHFVFC